VTTFKPYSFSKAERLHSKKLIKELFEKGSSFFLYPYKILILEVPKADEQQPEAQVMFTVSKRSFKKAVDRNRIKRLLREVYRLQKPKLPTHGQDVQFLIAILYIAKQEHPITFLQEKFIEAFKRLNKERR
jgi:ribonuclease P protein component